LIVRDSSLFVSCWATHGSATIIVAAVIASPNAKIVPRILFGTAAISLCVHERHRILLHWSKMSEANTQPKNL
jgi:hypothetical protein